MKPADHFGIRNALACGCFEGICNKLCVFIQSRIEEERVGIQSSDKQDFTYGEGA